MGLYDNFERLCAGYFLIRKSEKTVLSNCTFTTAAEGEMERRKPGKVARMRRKHHLLERSKVVLSSLFHLPICPQPP